MAVTRMTRKEIKYRLSGAQTQLLNDELQPHLERDKFFFETIHNIYYDNDSDALIRYSLQKPNPPFKEKIRLRTYELDGELMLDVFIELKKKYKGIVYKRREKLSLADARALVGGADPSTILPKGQVTNEILFFIQKTSIYPKLYLSYDRYSYKGTASNEDLRVTIDTNICGRREDLDFAGSKKDTPLLEPDESVLEIKTGFAYPLWLTQILSKHKIYPISFSKYGGLYTKLLLASTAGGTAQSQNKQNPFDGL